METYQVAIVLGQFCFAAMLYGWIAHWLLWPRLTVMPRAQALQAPLILQAFRYLGLIFLLPQVIGAELPRYFALPVALGDLLTASLAFGALAALRRQSSLGIPLAWLANLIGAVDFLYGYAVGITLHVPLGAAFYVPALFNPAMAVAHLVAFRLLLQKKTAAVALA
ncbi:MAG: hypothetical protein K1X75_17820 [Leptospirales bacterium]|nr:hypothetical protein [Leptospirales bacterium]